MEIRALSFDADQTLWDFRSVLQLALEMTARTMVDRGLAPAGSVDRRSLQAARDEVVGRFRGQPHSLEEVRRASFELVLRRAGCPDATGAADDLLEAFLEVRFNKIELYPEVRESLARLGRRYPIGLLSNGNSYPERCGLDGVFDAVVLGPSLGFEKPDPRAFETLARQLDVEPSVIAHVGDDWDDIEGANASGMTSIYLNRESATPAFRADADHEIQSLTDLETLLNQTPPQPA